MKLTLYLFQPSVQIFDNCLKPQTELRKYRDITKEENIDTYRVYMLQKEPTVPRWVSFLGNYVNEDVYGSMQSVAPAVTILFKFDDTEGNKRIMAATNGSAYSLLDTALIERKFGLKTTLNSIAPNMIKSLDYKDARARRLTKRESSPSATSIASFGFAYDNELIKSVSGRALDDEFGTTIAGGGSLKITMPDILISQLPDIGARLFQRFTEDTYRKHFEFIDYIEEVHSSYEITELDIALLEQIAKPPATSKLSVAYMHPASYVSSDYILATAKGEKERFDEISISDAQKFIQDNLSELDIDMLKNEAYIQGCNQDDQPVTPKTNIYRLLGCNISKEGDFVLHEGVWYRIQKEFLSLTRDEVKSATGHKNFPEVSWSLTTPVAHVLSDLGPDWQNIAHEWFTPRGHGKVFMTDAFHKPSQTLTVFNHTKSARSLNYQADQVIMLAELIRDADAPTVEALTRFLPDLADSKKRREQLTALKFAFFIGYQTDVFDELSVFDLLALKRAIKALRRLGFEVTIASQQTI